MAPKTQICASLTAANLNEAAEQLKCAAAAGADLAELRLDLLGRNFDPQKDLQQFKSASSLPLIVSCLPSSLGCVSFAWKCRCIYARHACLGDY
jgi:Type I 3-dehydroquinase